MTAASAVRMGRGRPLWALGGLMLCWIGLRAALFELPSVPRALPVETARTGMGLARAPQSRQHDARVTGSVPESVISPPVPHSIAPAPIRRLEQRLRAPTLLAPWPDRQAVAPEETRRIAGHNLLWMSAMQAIPLLPEIAAVLDRTESARAESPSRETARARPARWSGDAWLVLRPGLGRLAAAAGPAAPVYGGSQAGGVLRYDLAPGSPHRPAAFLRGVRALGRVREGDLAAGLALRPLGGVPVTAHGEARLSRRGAVLTLRPAAFLSGGIEDAPIARGITARGYAQTGYVGGRDATAFAEGSLIAEKPIWRDRDDQLTAGVGAWGGAQRGATRLDLGPTASLRLRVGAGTARLSADYRVRIAGNAEPAAAAAVTLTTGF